MPRPGDVPPAVRDLATRLAEPRPMRRGSLSERAMKCGQAGCGCQHDPQARHGPYLSLTRVEAGKTQSRYVGAAQAALAREQVEAGKQFRAHVEAYWRACEQWADAQLDAPEAAAPEGIKKRASEKPLRRRSSPRSKRS
jgi:Family of unknown function (DUF6788)